MKKSMPYVSIIILTFNGEKYIKNLLESLSDQTYPFDHTEIVIIDNASTDNTTSFVKENFPHIKCVELKKNLGFASGNNVGLNYASHEYLVFLNQDTICHQNWLKGLVDGMQYHKGTSACCSNIIPTLIEQLDNNKRIVQYNSSYFCDLSPFGYGHYRTVRDSRYIPTKLLSGCSFIIKRTTIRELGYLFDEDIWMYAEDTDLSLRLYKIGCRMYVVSDSVVFHLHNNKRKLSGGTLSISHQAIKNRVTVFFKNMQLIEFLVFFPLMFFGGIFKLLEFPLTKREKMIYFAPFSFFSMVSMTLAILTLPKSMKKRRLLLKKSHIKGGSIIRFLST